MNKKAEEIENVSAPLCLCDKKSRKDTDKYLFVSYSHRNAKIVYDALTFLYNASLNFMYDTKFATGDKWDKRAEEMLCNPNCIGVIIFISPELIQSEACEKELLLCRKIMGEKNKPFKLFPISIDGKSINETIRDAYISLATLSTSELDKTLPTSRIANMIGTIGSNILFLSRDENNLYLEKLIKDLKEYNENLFSSDELVLTKLSRLSISKTIDGIRYISLGCFPQKSVIEFSANTNSENIASLNGSKFECNPVEWIILENDDKTVLAISKYVLYKCQFNDITDFFDSFNLLSPKRDLECIEKIEVPNISDLINNKQQIGKNIETDYSKSNKTGLLFLMYWGKHEGSFIVYRNNLSYEKIENFNKANVCGIRPCITINVETLLKQF